MRWLRAGLMSAMGLVGPAAQASAIQDDLHAIRRERGDVVVVEPDARSGRDPQARRIRVGDRLPSGSYPATGKARVWVRSGSDMVLVETRTRRVLRIAASR